MNEHTKEPWGISSGPFFPSTPVANARRIVACVNACEGIPIDMLEAGNGIADAVRHFQQQRDELLAALGEAEDAIHVLLSFYAPHGGRITGRVAGTEGLPLAQMEVEKAWLAAVDAEAKARAAIAKVKP